LSLRLLERSVQMLVGAILWVAILTILLPGAAEAQSNTASMKGDGSTTRSIVVVGPGDSLWLISQERLGADATSRQIDKETERIYELNRDRIGADPNLIFPGQKLLVAPEGESASDRGGEPRVSESAAKKKAPASEKAAKTPVKTSTTDPQAEPAAPPALPAAQAVPRAGTVTSFASIQPFALVIIVVAVWLLAILMWTLRMRERREARKRSSAWAAHYGKNYTRFDPYSRFEDYFLKAAPPEVGNSLDRIEIFAAARARRSALLPRRGLAISRVHNPEIRRHLRSASRTRRRRVQGTFPRDREEGGDR
jgi:hypothetical protein